jgi:hypothetical protein
LGKFEFLGIFGIFCLIIWFLLASNTPDKSRFISEKERKFLSYQLKENKKTVLVENEVKSVL